MYDKMLQGQTAGFKIDVREGQPVIHAKLEIIQSATVFCEKRSYGISLSNRLPKSRDGNCPGDEDSDGIKEIERDMSWLEMLWSKTAKAMWSMQTDKFITVIDFGIWSDEAMLIDSILVDLGGTIAKQFARGASCSISFKSCRNMLRDALGTRQESLSELRNLPRAGFSWRERSSAGA
ncbi:hypothetical protein FISHEDRAFT_61848 [Fistulina hepatica ATCC 64428]|uniref:Uncharacterized protein n=1 Tax=Fistulina hepatica ATCC 64428 TaxID=1128425 RepID=A0A0D7A193_9AGAR|nr:hypothetical protein FISHEDRAFT_61848 [Fistulina hepatica ATCC 64428]